MILLEFALMSCSDCQAAASEVLNPEDSYQRSKVCRNEQKVQVVLSLCAGAPQAERWPYEAAASQGL